MERNTNQEIDIRYLYDEEKKQITNNEKEDMYTVHSGRNRTNKCT